MKNKLKNKRFWQIQGLNLIQILIPVMSRFCQLALYATVINLTLYSSSQGFNKNQVNLLLSVFSLIALAVIFYRNFKANVWKITFSPLDWAFAFQVKLCMVAIEYGTLQFLFLTFCNSKIQANGFSYLSSFFFYSLFIALGLRAIKKFCLSEITRHFEVAEEEKQWKNWVVIQSIDTIKARDYSLSSLTNRAESWLEKTKEKTTVRLHFSWLTLCEERVVDVKHTNRASECPSGMFERS